jgi:hypothetical protein
MPETRLERQLPPARHLSYRVREFSDYLADYFKGIPDWDTGCIDGG